MRKRFLAVKILLNLFHSSNYVAPQLTFLQKQEMDSPRWLPLESNPEVCILDLTPSFSLIELIHSVSM